MKLPPTPPKECRKMAIGQQHKKEQHRRHNFPPKIICTNKRGPTIKEYPRQSGSHLRVTFEVDENNEVRALEAEAAAPSTRSSSREDRRRFWWSRSELMKIWKREQAICDFHRRSTDDYADQIRRVFSRCCSKHYEGEQLLLSSHSSFSSLSSCRFSSQSADDVQLLAARSSNRGLEHRVVHIMLVHREKHLQGVLDQQAKVAHLNPLQRQQMIRSKSNFLSRPAKAFALVVAAADARVAQTTLDASIRDLVPLEQFSESFLWRNEESFRSKLSDSFQWGESFRLQAGSPLVARMK